MSKFIKKKFMNLANDDPLQISINLVRTAKTKSYTILNKSMEETEDIIKRVTENYSKR